MGRSRRRRRRGRRRAARRAGLRHRGRERDHPGDEDHRRPRDAAVGLLDREHADEHDRPGREQPGDGRRHDAGREERDHRGDHDERPRAPGAERHRLAAHLVGLVDDEHVGIVEMVARAPLQVPSSSRVSPISSVDSPGSSSPCAERRATTRSPLSVTMPGNAVSPIEPGARRDHDLRDAGARREQRLRARRRARSARRASGHAR